jgi:carboxylesterase
MENKVGVLVLHGFLGNLKTIEYQVQFFRTQGFLVEAPSLRGHNTVYTDLEKVKFTDWIEDAESAYKNLSLKANKVFVFGLSMGGALALYLEAQHAEISGGILVNHALSLYPNWKLKFLPIIKYFVKYIYSPGSDIKDKTQKNLAYDYIPTGALLEFLRLISLVKKELPLVNQPQLIFKSIEDHVIPQDSVEITLKSISSKQKEVVFLKNSYHVATADFDKDIICEKSLEFINKILKEG